MTIEDCNLSAWARLWGRSLHRFSPGTLVAELERETTAVAKLARMSGGVLRASTATALSQRCLCGAKVAKSLRDRTHHCTACGIIADRDAMSAALASVVAFGDPAKSSTAFIDLERARSLVSDTSRDVFAKNLEATKRGRQDARSESTVQSTLDGSSAEEPERTPGAVAVVARQIAGTAPSTTPDETGNHCRTTSERARTRTSLSHGGTNSPPLRDSS
jgi:hypothetical protein